MLVSALSLVVAASPFTVGAPVQVAPVGLSPSIDCSPTECVVAWIRYDHGPEQDACVAIATFSAQKPTPVLSLLTCEGGVPTVAASPKATLVSWSTGKHLMGTAITNGRPGPIFKIQVEQRADSVDAAFDGQRFVLVWSTSKQVSMLRLSPQAQLLDEKPVVLATARELSNGSVGCAAGKCLVTHVERPMNENQRLSAVVLENGVPVPTTVATRALEGIVTTSANELVALSTDSSRVVRTTQEGRSLLVLESSTTRMRDLEAASFAARTLVGWVVDESGPKGIELMLLPVDGQTRGVVGATLAGDFDPSFATADGKTFWVVTNRWPEKNRGDWPTVVVRKVTVP